MTISRVRILTIPSRSKLPMDSSELCEMATKRWDSSRAHTAWLSKWYVTSLDSAHGYGGCEEVRLSRFRHNKTSRTALGQDAQKH